MYLISLVGLIGVDRDQLAKRPLLGWRRQLQRALYFLARVEFFVIGLHHVDVKGEMGDAPVLVVAPHATFIDSIAVAVSGATPVAKAETANVLLVGKIVVFAQVLLVKREKAESRKNALDQIRRHVFNVRNSIGHSYRRPLLLFPEGTCTNGKALIHFKAGAFQNGSGVSVQPVLLRFPSRPETLTWTWDQNYGALTCLWLTLCQFNTRCEVEFLPTYHPSKSEVMDPKLFARNVREVMARNLDVPIVDVRLEDGKSEKGGSGNGKALARRDSVVNDIHVDVDNDDEDFDPKKLGMSYVDFTGNVGLVV